MPTSYAVNDLLGGENVATQREREQGKPELTALCEHDPGAHSDAGFVTTEAYQGDDQQILADDQSK